MRRLGGAELSSKDINDKYWSEYTAIQAAKHELLKRYLGGWFPILTRYSGRVLYVDCHAGRGRYKEGQPGSPIVALTTLLSHSLRDKILANCEVIFYFMENDEENTIALKEELSLFKDIPHKVEINIITTDYESALEHILNNLNSKGKNLAPSFLFVDPYGFKLRMDLLKQVLCQPSSELLINFMVRYIDMAIAHPAQEPNMDLLFGTSDWKELRNIANPTQRHTEMIRLYTKSLGCIHSSVLEMRGEHREPKYSLVHATNHRRGRELMKSVMWKVTPDGSFTIYQSDNPNQETLITAETDLRPLITAIMKSFKGRIKYSSLKDWLIDTIWDYPHLNRVLKDLKNKKKIIFTDYEGKFGFIKDPTIIFISNE